jgi:secreted trypsin-like serine protease
VKPRTVAPLLLAVALCATTVLAASASAASRPARIVGGVPATVAAAPWTAFLVAAGRTGPQGQFCGATVVSATAVVTAAHCVVDSGIRNFDVVAGRTTLSGTDGQRLPVSSVDVDPGYNPGRTGHDAAVVHLASPAVAPPIATATADQAGLAAAGSRLLLTGWGLVANNDSATPDNLQQATITAASNRRCRLDYPGAFIGTEMICTTGGRPDACRGDSGGPLVSLDGGVPTLVGIVSFGGRRCGDPRFPGVYTRVSFEAGFIADALNLPPAQPVTPVAPGSQVGVTYGPVRERIGNIDCGRAGCQVTVRVSGATSAVSKIRVRVRGSGGYDPTATAVAVSPGVYRASVRLPLGRVKINAFGLGHSGRMVGTGDAPVVRVAAGS